MTYKQIYKYRSVWMGIAILFVIWYHMPQHLPSLIIKNVKVYSHIFVDIFVFASGLGCAFSYRRNRDLFVFIKRRLLRIYPSYLIFMLFWIPLYSIFIRKMPFRFIIGNIVGLEYLAHPEWAINWYFSYIVIMYFMTPFLVEFIERADKTWKKLLILLILISISLPFYGSFDYMILTVRIPSYAIGVYFALNHAPDEKVSRKTVVIMTVCALVGILLIKYFYNNFNTEYALCWYPLMLMAPGFSFMISWVCEKISGSGLKAMNLILKILTYLGSISLEIYLVHLFLLHIYGHYYQGDLDLSVLIPIMLTIPLAVLLKKGSDRVRVLLSE